MKLQKTIQIGAEAEIILSDSNVIKRRVKKSYRIPEIDKKIRKLRTRSEIKLLEKASKLINVPNLLEVKNQKQMARSHGVENNYEIYMEFIKGKKLSDYLDKFPLEEQKEICKTIGQDVAKLHDENIIHGDLTTSNMILVEDFPAHSRSQINKNKDNLVKSNRVSYKDNGKFAENELKVNKRIDTNDRKQIRAGRRDVLKIYFIDFGLGFISNKLEDKAVDIHLLKQALEAKHFGNWKVLFNKFVRGYKISKESKKVIERLEAVERRGRYKEKY